MVETASSEAGTNYLVRVYNIILESMDLDNKTEQTQTENSADDSKQPDANTDSSNTIDLGDGNTVTLDELKSGYMRQSDYTKKTQELSEKKKDLELSEEDTKTVELLKKAGFATVDELANYKKDQAQKEDFGHFVSNTNLSEAQLKMVTDLKQVNPDKSYGDIAKDYGLIDDAKLNMYKGSGGGIKGSSFALPAKEEPYKVDVTQAGYNPTQAAKVAQMKF